MVIVDGEDLDHRHSESTVVWVAAVLREGRQYR